VIWGALLLLVLLAAGLGAFSVFAAREQARTQAALERERERAAEAEERFELAREAADALIRASEEELADRPFLEGPRQRLLEAALVYYQKFIEQRQDDPEAQAELVATQERIKKVLADLAVLRAAGDLFHLARQSVANDLGLTPEQRARLDVLFARQGARWARLLRNQDRLSPQDRRQKLLDLPRISDAEARRILEPGQLQRLRQVAIQLQGTSAFRDQEVVTALGLTADQRARARAIEDELFLAGRPARPGAAPGDVRRAWDSKVNAAIERILASLTPEQVKRWKELTGEPFAGSRLVPFQGVPGGRPGQRRPPPRDAETR
jgi:hypothetical protein